MRLVGIGVDIVEIARIAASIERHGERFLRRIFTDEELRYCAGMKTPAPFYAARFAAKEAVSKAFGTGIGARLGWLDIEVQRRSTGAPFIVLRGQGLEFAVELGISEVLLSISHSQHYAVANAVAIATPI